MSLYRKPVYPDGLDDGVVVGKGEDVATTEGEGLSDDRGVGDDAAVDGAALAALVALVGGDDVADGVVPDAQAALSKPRTTVAVILARRELI